MNLPAIRARLRANGLYHSEEPILGRDTVIGYDKQFRWEWLATQLNTFIVATDFADEPVTVAAFEHHAFEALRYAELNYGGWPRGLQSGLAIVQVLLSRDIAPLAAQYCLHLGAKKQFAGMVVPVAANPVTGEVHAFENSPMWGRIYFPYFKQLIADLDKAGPTPTPPPLPSTAPPPLP